MNHGLRRLLPAALALLALPCLPARGQTECSTLGQVGFVADTLEDMYLWYRELPDLDRAAFDSPEAYLEAARYRTLDEHFSYIAPLQEQQAYYSDSQFVGLGITNKQTGPEELRIAQAFPDSPASDAGLVRGDYLVEIGGRSVAELLRTGEIDDAFGPREIGIAVELAWRTTGGEERRATLVKRLVTIPTVSETRTLDLDGRRVGYVHLRNFVEPSIDALDAAFTRLRSEAVEDLVLDLRYNGGGLVSVAQHLGGLVGGFLTSGSVFARMVHNDKNTFRNRTLPFGAPEAALDLPRLLVVTTRSSASASELVINALRPFLPVTLVGETTFGKPVGQYGFTFCDKILYPVSFSMQNAVGHGDFFGGIPADCAAGDDLDRPLGEPTEASLAEALEYVRTGRCSTQAAKAHSQLAARPRPEYRDGWQQVLNAY